MNELTLHEVIHGQPPSVKHLHAFGKKCFLYILEEKGPAGTKGCEQADEGIFVWYNNFNKIFREHISSKHKIFDTRQICFSLLDTGEAPTVKQQLVGTVIIAQPDFPAPELPVVI